MKFRYEGDDARTYPSLMLEVVPGDVVDLDAAPDFRFSPVVDVKASKPSKEETVSDAPSRS